MKILVAEDNDMTAEILRLHLRKHGFEAIHASNGAEALGYLESTLDISLVVTDLMMPEMDGFELLSEMRRRPELSEIPVVLTSAWPQPEVVTKAAELGCRQFLVKPVSNASLLNAIRTALKEKRSLLRPQHEVVDQLGVDSGTYRKLVGYFASIAEAVVAKLEQCLVDQGQGGAKPDHIELARLLEAANLLGADRLAGIAARLTKDAASTNGKDDAAQWRLLLRELTILLSTMQARSLPSQGQREKEPQPGASKESEEEANQGGRSLGVKKRVVRVP
jgi:CheY-like chemotaxis protein